MSSLEFCLELTASAQNDLRDILSYTAQQWGEEKLVAYKNTIHKAFESIKDNPLIGREKMIKGLSVHAFRIESHDVYYLIHARTIIVLRILHEKMDSSRHIDEQ